MNVEISAEAEGDLEAIGDHIARDEPARAIAFVAELRRKCHALGDLPRGFPLVPEFDTIGIRKRTCGNYLIFYRVEADRVAVLHILHGAMDYNAALFPE